MPNAGIYGVGVYLPEVVRTNDYWPAETVARWGQKTDGKLDRPASSAKEEELAGSRIVLEEMGKFRGDPFKGFRERRIMPEGMLTSTMEIEAGQRALEAAGVKAEEIDVLLTYSTLPDYHMVANAATVHHGLGLKTTCYTAQTDGVCNAFMQQMTYVEPMIRLGTAKRALIIQSSGTSRLVRQEDPKSAWFGDGATAVVVGPVAEEYGVRGWAHETWSHLVHGIVCGVPGKRWYDGAPYAYIEEQSVAREMLVGHFHESRRLIHTALERGGLTPEAVDFYACHQGFAWLREATQRHAGLERAKSVDTYAFAGSLLGGNVPLVLHTALQEGLLREGDNLVAYSGAAGAMISALTLKWGGRSRDGT
jgi:3-oxoacyl-[acyl-carrier-protein] synthase-3